MTALGHGGKDMPIRGDGPGAHFISQTTADVLAVAAAAQAMAYPHFRDSLHAVAGFVADVAQPFAFAYLLMQIYSWVERRLKKPAKKKVAGDREAP